MASEERAQRTAEVLRDTLIDLAGRTSSELHGRLNEICGPCTPAMTGAGFPEIRAAIRGWRDGAAAAVRAAFKRLLGLAKSPEAAESLLWEGIDAAFKWSPPRRENSKSFDEWLGRAGVDTWEIEGFKLRSPECERHQKLPDQLNCDFRTLFELCIAQVAVDAFATQAKVTDTSFGEESTSLSQSDDYRTIKVEGDEHKYLLTRDQALIVRTLHDAYKNGSPRVSARTLLKAVNAPTTSKLKDRIRKGDIKEFWKKYVLRSQKDRYELKFSPRNLTPSGS